MKLTNRERVDGTPVTIGHRIHYRDGRKQASRKYSAEYRDPSGKQVCESLGTSNRQEARRMAVEIFNRLRDGQPRVVEDRRLFAEHGGSCHRPDIDFYPAGLAVRYGYCR